MTPTPDPAPLHVSVASPEEWRELRAVRLAALEADPAAFGSNLARELTYDEERWRGWAASGATFLARLRAQPVGMTGVHQRGDDLTVGAMWVSPVARGHGVGGALLDEAVGHARRLGAARLHLWVTDGNVAATTLYLSRGFRYDGESMPLASDPALTARRLALLLRD